jgi:Tol biopolymer transport system component
VGEPGLYHQIALSPDEGRVAVEIRGEEGWDLWVIDVARGGASRLTSDPANERDPVWSPDGQRVAYGWRGGGEVGLSLKGLGGEPARAIPGAVYAEQGSFPVPIPDSWSGDGSTLIYKTLGGTTVWALPLVGGGDAEPVLELGSLVDEAQISPDGQWLAYISDESGTWEVYVAPFGRAGERVRVSVGGGGQPKWRADGKELFYAAADSRLMAVDVRVGSRGPDVSLPTALFELKVMPNPMNDGYGVSADGQRFLVKVPVEEDSGTRIHIVTNWTSLLE